MLVSYTYPNLSSPFTWYHPHNIGHHQYTNVSCKDPDLYHMDRLQRTIGTTKYEKIFAHQWITLFIGWLLSYIGLIISPNINNIRSGSYFKLIPTYPNKFVLIVELVHIGVGTFLSVIPYCYLMMSIRLLYFALYPLSITFHMLYV